MFANSIEENVKIYMKNVLDTLREENRLTDIDTAHLDILRMSYIQVLKMEELLSVEGFIVMSPKGEPKAHPAVKIGNEARTQVNRALEALSLTNKIRYKQKNSDKVSILDQFLADETI